MRSSTQDSDLAELVVQELSWVSDVAGSRIDVQVVDGLVTLQGAVASCTDRERVGEAVLRVGGVRGLTQHVLVEDTWFLADADVTQEVREALHTCAEVPGTVRVVVDAGVVTLTGDVGEESRWLAAGEVVKHLKGVRGVVNRTTWQGARVPADVARRVHAALARALGAHHETIDVGTDDAGVVTLRGAVASETERRSAVSACWSCPGVSSVHDALRVRS